MNVFVLLNTKQDILKNVGNRAVLGHHWLPQYFFSYYGSQWCPKTAWLQTFFKISSFVFSRRVSKSWQNFNFWVNYPFNYLNNLFRFLRWLQNCICTEIKLKCLYSNENSFKIIKERKYQTHLIMFFFFSRFIFAIFIFIRIGQIRTDRKPSKREIGGRIEKVPQVSIRTRDTRSTTALYVGALPTRLLIVFTWRHTLGTPTWRAKRSFAPLTDSYFYADCIK